MEQHDIALLVSSLGIGGAERHMVALANMLAERYAVHLVYIKSSHELLPDIDCARIRSITCLEAASGIDVRAVRRLRGVLRTHRVRLVLCANMFALLYAQLARWWQRRRPVVVEVFHTTVISNWRARMLMLIYAPLLWFGAHLVFISTNQQEYWRCRRLWAPRIHLIRNGVDLEHYACEEIGDLGRRFRSEHGIGVSDKVIAICAVLRPEKAHQDLLAAVARAHAAGYPWRVLIVGDGPMRQAIEASAARLGLSGFVKLTGMIRDVRPALAAADAVALVSVAVETLSIAALEAMAMARPLLMSDIGGASELVVDGENGRLFPPGDVEELARCLVWLWNVESLAAMGVRSRERAESSFSLSYMGSAYEALIDDCLRASDTVLRS
ncbi:MAG: glycosyltransferase [Candidatus Krumholzibacteria bacterium]|nr:glycosyltransferase [Candidatus Krumholzibacteria bacterium]